ncbi:MAG: GNAT family N-acetyltransferase [Ruminiclostridium sp.]
MLEIVKADINEKDTMMNLLEKYLYEFSQWEKLDVDDCGNYGYEYLDCYFTEENRFPYFLKVDGKLAGLVLVSDYPEVPEEETDFCLSEFFVMNKYRRKGYGKEAAFRVFDMHHGRWQLKRHPHNTASVSFWDNVINEYTSGNFRLVKGYPNKEVYYEDGTAADVFFFTN